MKLYLLCFATVAYQVMGGLKSADFENYTKQCVQAFLVARKHAKQVKALIEIMNFHSSYPCFRCVFFSFV